MDIEKMLSIGDPRSLGKIQEVVEIVLKNSDNLDSLFYCLFTDNDFVRMRASDALEKICKLRPEWFNPYKQELLNKVPLIRQPSVQWHLAQILSEIELSKTEQEVAITILKNNLSTMDDWIVVNLTLQSLAYFAKMGTLDNKDFIEILEKQKSNKYRSVRSRVAKLLREFQPS